MSKNKKLKVINQTKRKKLDRILASTLAGVLFAGALAGGGYCAYKQIKDRDNTIADQKTTIVALEDENKISKEKIEQLTIDLSAKVSEIAEKDKQIAEKDNLIEENNHKIQTLNNQKTTLLTSVSEIDNKLTSTTDAVDVDNLEARKTAILGQIDTLNAEIANLTAEKTQLQTEIATLTDEKTQLQNKIIELQEKIDQLESTSASNAGTITVGDFEYMVYVKMGSSNYNFYVGDLVENNKLINLSNVITSISKTRDIKFTYLDDL